MLPATLCKVMCEHLGVSPGQHTGPHTPLLRAADPGQELPPQLPSGLRCWPSARHPRVVDRNTNKTHWKRACIFPHTCMHAHAHAPTPASPPRLPGTPQQPLSLQLSCTRSGVQIPPLPPCILAPLSAPLQPAPLRGRVSFCPWNWGWLCSCRVKVRVPALTWAPEALHMPTPFLGHRATVRTSPGWQRWGEVG